MSKDIFNLESGVTSNPFELSPSTALRESFNSFITDHPMWLVYVRRDTRFPSPTSYDPSTRSPDTDDRTSFGMGYSVQYEKHAVRRVIRAGAAQSPMDLFGYLAKFRTVIYTPRYYYPKSKDLYLEVEWDVEPPLIEQYGKPIRIINAYQVDEAIGFSDGEIVFFGCGCDTYNFTIGDLEEWMLQLGSVWTPKKVI